MVISLRGSPTLVFFCVAALAASAQAIPFGFESVNTDNALDAAIGVAQLSLEVTDAGGGQVLFTFSNVGPKPCSITHVYIEGGWLAGIVGIDNDPGFVEFSPGSSPPNLAGWATLDPKFAADPVLNVSSDSPVQPMGVNPGETLGITYNLDGTTFTELITAIQDLNMRIGIHVQGYESGGSESFIVPEPATLAMLALGCFLFRKSKP